MMRAIISFLLVVFLSGCAEGRSQSVDAVAVVDGAPISVEYFEQTYVQFLITTGENDTALSRYVHLANLIDAFLLAAEARAQGLTTDPQFVDFQRREQRKAVGSAFFDEAFLATLPELTDQQIRTAFRQTKEQRVVRHLFYRDRRAADEAYARLKSGRSFLEEAVECYGLAQIDSSAGFLGPVKYFQVDPAFARAAFNTPIDSFTAPVRSRFGFHIIHVDDAYYNPLITESEYQVKKKGVASQLRHQIRLSEGDQFVRSYMEGLDVQVNRAGVGALAAALKEIENRVEPDPVEVLQNESPEASLSSDENTAALLEGLSPSTPLATYNYNGSLRTFTAGEYFFWLEDLPFPEAVERTGASVGRALRNEVFAMAGDATALASDLEVIKHVGNRERLKLAEMMRESRNSVDVEPTDGEVLDAFERSRLSTVINWQSTFWTIKFESRQEASEAKRRIESGSSAPDQYSAYLSYRDQQLADVPQWRNAVVAAPLSTLGVVGIEADWYVFQVSDRRQVSAGREAELAEIKDLIRPLVPVYRLLNELRANLDVKVDSVRFKEIMVLGRDPIK